MPQTMGIISHRGWWLEPGEKNSEVAFRRSFEAGFGTETDVRDLNGTLVISHDMPTEGAMALESFLDLFTSIDPGLPLAMNIKSDGLFDPLAEAFSRHGISNWFAFDMSVPDMVQFQRRNMPFYTRQSDLEPMPALLADAHGIWIDEFDTPWFEKETLLTHCQEGRELCLVSPDLHGRPHEPVWARWRAWLSETEGGSVTLCTDYPEAAQAFFTGPST